ncbi:MAG: class I SAM-dependent methyltransferase [Anaerolineae bacterium]
MTEAVDSVRADFDRIAQFSTDEWSHNSHYHAFLLKQLPAHINDALEIGCGTGLFSRQLAQRAQHVLALDLSPEMIRLAKQRAQAYRHIDFEVADILHRELPPAHFDCIASIATLHHLPLAEILAKAAQALKPGGTLLVLDLYHEALNMANLAPNAAAVVVNAYYKLVKTGRLKDSPEAQAAWEAHGQHDVYPTLAEVRRVSAAVLPGAQVRVHLLWRYSLVWTKPLSR